MGRRTRSTAPQARAEDYDRHLDAVYGLVAAVTGDAAAAVQVTRDVFAGLHPGVVGPDGTLASCLAVDAHRRAVRWVRDSRIAHGADMRAVAAAAELLDRLPAAERGVIVDAYFAGLTYAEIAARRGLAPAEVARLMSAGLRHLATWSSHAPAELSAG